VVGASEIDDRKALKRRRRAVGDELILILKRREGGLDEAEGEENLGPVNL